LLRVNKYREAGKMKKCECEGGYKRCKEAEHLWRQANNIYYAKGYDAWINCTALGKYQKHMEKVIKIQNKQQISVYL